MQSLQADYKSKIMGFIRKKRYFIKRGSIKRNLKRQFGLTMPKGSGKYLRPDRYLKRKIYEATTISQDDLFTKKKKNIIKSKFKRWIIIAIIAVLWVVGLFVKD